MRRTKNYFCIHITTAGNLPMLIKRVPYALWKGKGATISQWMKAWQSFKKQVKRWIKERGYADAEERFVLNYSPGAAVQNPEDVGALTDGLLFTYKGHLYWDESYAVKSFLDTLLEKGEVTLRNQGEFYGRVK